MNTMTLAEVHERYLNLINGYVDSKALLNDVYMRNGKVQTDAILNEIRAINDHIARYFDDNRSIMEKYEELVKAEGHLRRMVYDAYKQLNIFFFDSMNSFEEAHFGTHWFHINDGMFWSEYKQGRSSITNNIKAAKIQESISTKAAVAYFEQAYIQQRYLYKLIEDNRERLVLPRSKKKLHWLNSQKGWFISTVVLAVTPALIWKLGTHFSEIISQLTSFFPQVFYAFCAWGMSLYQ